MKTVENAETFDHVTTLATTSKGHRIWLQGLERWGWAGGTRYNVQFDSDVIWLTRQADGKRKVTDAKGGIIDIVGKKVSQWAAQGPSANRVLVEVLDDNRILLVLETTN